MLVLLVQVCKLHQLFKVYYPLLLGQAVLTLLSFIVDLNLVLTRPFPLGQSRFTNTNRSKFSFSYHLVPQVPNSHFQFLPKNFETGGSFDTLAQKLSHLILEQCVSSRIYFVSNLSLFLLFSYLSVGLRNNDNSSPFNR